MIEINTKIVIPEKEIEEHFIHASGPGGQNVNKVATAVQLRFNVAHSTSLPEDLKQRLVKLAQGRISSEGILIIEASRHRSQERNREDARNRLVDLIRKAAKRPKRRIPTKPTVASKRRRIETKRRRGALKKQRQEPAQSD